jgi:hypothetical protein
MLSIPYRRLLAVNTYIITAPYAPESEQASRINGVSHTIDF